MIESMTGYGMGKSITDDLEIQVEIKSVNGRYLDIRDKLPARFMSFGEDVRRSIKSKIKRGSIDIRIMIKDGEKESVSVKLNEEIVKKYLKIESDIKTLGGTGSLDVANIIRLPEVISIDNEDDDLEIIRDLLIRTTEEALDNLVKGRRLEGEKLQEDLLNKISKLYFHLEEIERIYPTLKEDIFNKKRERIIQIIGDETLVDEEKLLTEAGILADKIAIDEEIVRLRGHLELMYGLLTSEEVVEGKKLDFISQEIHREANTMGVKVGDLGIIQTVVEIKLENEKIREQVQNIQ